MLALFISGFAILFILAIGLYFAQKSAFDKSGQVAPPPPDFRGLFAEDSSTRDAQRQIAAAEREREQAALFERAQNGDRSALDEAHKAADATLYNRILTELTGQADSDTRLLSLVSYLARGELPVNAPVARAVAAWWRNSPDRHSTAKALHFAALSNNAGLYSETVEEALQLWRAGKLSDISPVELRALFDGEFWLLSSRSRRSGAGFVLKRTLDNARRELEAQATVSNPSVSEGNSANEALPHGRASDIN